ncbi:MAG: pyridoxal phosphate-dependent decarboxylase family protein [Candidatus Saccharicenans sp.]|nr:MAG: aspartate aminotransferase family protein [Candidatus Aminicenantes bacterium]HEK85375.1 aminotransferase class V-fold PLP-dependent enzyme [Candidatus Aminicenantes bacterium]
MNKEKFKKYGYEIIDWIADYLENVEQYPVKSTVKPGEIKNLLPSSPPAHPEEMEAIWQDFKKIIIPGLTHWQHPGWFAYFPSNNSPASILGELLSAGLGTQGMVWETSPAATELEEVVMDWLRQMIGLPESFAGVIQDTASTATLCALLAAREKATGFAVNTQGFSKILRVYASKEAHSSVEKGVKIAGYGRKNLVYIPTDEEFALIPGELEKAIEEDLKFGFQPACVIATVGTTSSGAVDPLKPIGEIGKKYNLWFHVDAAYAGTAAILPEKRWALEGAEQADSLVFNPHKWMLTNFDCSAFFVRQPEILTRTFEIHPEYLKTGVDAVVKNYRDWGIQLGRRFRALKLWFVIRTYGLEGIKKIIRQHIHLAELFSRKLQEDKRFELLAPVYFSLVCFRLNDGRGEEELNLLNKQLLEAINSTGKIYLTHTTLNGKYTLRLVVGQRTTEERHVRQALEIIKTKADSLLGQKLSG